MRGKSFCHHQIQQLHRRAASPGAGWQRRMKQAITYGCVKSRMKDTEMQRPALDVSQGGDRILQEDLGGKTELKAAIELFLEGQILQMY